MARRETVTLVDDVSGEAADETVRFGLDGVAYEIDLEDSRAAELRESLAEFVAAARRVSGRQTRGTASSRPSGSGYNRETLQAAREWGRRNGWTVKDRGRIPADLMDAFQKSA